MFFECTKAVAGLGHHEQRESLNCKDSRRSSEERSGQEGE